MSKYHWGIQRFVSWILDYPLANHSSRVFLEELMAPLPSGLTASVESIIFSDVKLGVRSAWVQVVVTNSGESKVLVRSVEASHPFALRENQPPKTLAPGAQIVINVSVRLTGYRAYAGKLLVVSNQGIEIKIPLLAWSAGIAVSRYDGASAYNNKQKYDGVRILGN